MEDVVVHGRHKGILVYSSGILQFGLMSFTVHDEAVDIYLGYGSQTICKQRLCPRAAIKENSF